VSKRRIPMPPPSKVRPGKRREPLELEEEMAEALRRPCPFSCPFCEKHPCIGGGAPGSCFNLRR